MQERGGGNGGMCNLKNVGGGGLRGPVTRQYAGLFWRLEKKNRTIVEVTDSCFRNYQMRKSSHQGMSRPSPGPGRLNNMCNLFHHLLKEVFWHIVSGNLTTPICMMKYILGSQETYEEIVCNNPLNARHKR